MFTVTENFGRVYPGAHAGYLCMRAVTNPPAHAGLEETKRALENDLRARFAGQEPRSLDTYGPVPAYNAYYKAFNKSYHVQGQLASIIFKGKAIPSVAALVEAMFIAEIKNALLTAGHDLDRLELPVTLDVASGNEKYVVMRGVEQATKANDMFMADRAGIISSILYGPDQRTQITPETRNVLFTVYAPAGIPAASVRAHLEDIQRLVLLVSPAAQTEAMQVVPGF